MSDQRPDDVEQPERRVLPVVWGLLSLVAVAAIVGGVLALGAAFATRATGLASSGSGSGETTTSAARNETLFLPEPSETDSKPTPYVTLSDVPEPPLPPSTFSDTPAAPETSIELFAAEDAVSPMEPINLSGRYLGGSGAILQVQQLQGGAWADFPVTVSVNGDEFSTFIQASAVGTNRFRLVDSGTGEVSNEVTVEIG